MGSSDSGMALSRKAPPTAARARRMFAMISLSPRTIALTAMGVARLSAADCIHRRPFFQRQISEDRADVVGDAAVHNPHGRQDSLDVVKFEFKFDPRLGDDLPLDDILTAAPRHNVAEDI